MNTPQVSVQAAPPRSKRSVKGMVWQEQLDGSYALIADTDEQASRAARSNMSISVAHAVQQCPAQHLGKCNLPRIEQPFDPNVLGTAVHDVLEFFYKLPAAQRTEDQMRRMVQQAADEMWAENKLAAEYPQSLEVNRQLRNRWHDIVLAWVLRILLMENPQEVQVIATEFEFKGQQTSNGVQATAKVDRMDRNPDGGVDIVDYKLGVWHGEPNPRFKDGYKEQGHMYGDLVTHVLGESVSSVSLMYPRAEHRRYIPYSSEDSDVHLTLAGIKEAADQLKQHVATKTFPAKPSSLCGWCDLARSCPVARIPRLEDAKETRWKTLEAARGSAIKACKSVATKRSSVQLGIPVVRRTGVITAVLDDSWVDEFARNHLREEPRITESTTEVDKKASLTMNEINPVDQAMATPRAEGRMDDEMAGPTFNLNSIAARNISDVIEYSLWLLREHAQPLNTASLAGLSDLIATIVRRVQFRFSGIRRFGSGSASRTLHAVKASIRTINPPFGASAQEWGEWVNRIEFLANAMLENIDRIYANENLDVNDHVQQIASLFSAPAPFDQNPQ